MPQKRKKRRSLSAPSKREFNAILEAKALGLWANSVKGCLKFLTQLGKVSDGEGAEWIKGNRDYYLKRVQHLLDNVPKGAVNVAREARKLLAKLK